jgi:hypothetical protein
VARFTPQSGRAARKKGQVKIMETLTNFGLSRHGAKLAHFRWHVYRRRTSPSCEFCGGLLEKEKS